MCGPDQPDSVGDAVIDAVDEVEAQDRDNPRVPLVWGKMPGRDVGVDGGVAIAAMVFQVAPVTSETNPVDRLAMVSGPKWAPGAFLESSAAGALVVSSLRAAIHSRTIRSIRNGAVSTTGSCSLAGSASKTLIAVVMSVMP